MRMSVGVCGRRDTGLNVLLGLKVCDRKHALIIGWVSAILIVH